MKLCLLGVEDYVSYDVYMNFNGGSNGSSLLQTYDHLTMVSEFPAVYHVIKGSKVRLDYKIGQNQGVPKTRDDFL